MSQVMDVGNSDNVLTMPFMKKSKEEVTEPAYDSYEAVREALGALEGIAEEAFEEGPVIDLTLDLPPKKEEVREMSTVEVYLNMSQNIKSLNGLLSKMKYYLDELDSIEKTVR